MPNPPEFDVSSAEPVLFYTGPGITAAPADDLSANALARLAWIAAGPGRPSSPADMPQKAIASVRDELVASGHYRKTRPKETTE